MARPTLQQRFAKTCQWSLAWHLLLVATALFVGTFSSGPSIPESIEIEMLDDVVLPKGNSDDPGLGTYKEEPLPPAAEPPAPQVAPPPPAPPAETAPPVVAPPPPPVKTEAPPPPRDAMAEPVKAPVKAPAKTPEKNSPAKTPAKTPTNTSTRTTAPAAKVPTSQGDLLKTLGTIKPVTRQGNPGEQNSDGWKLGTGTAPIKEVPIGAVLNQYRQQAKARVQGRWVVPASIKALPPKVRPSATVHISVSPSGAITGSNWVKKSGDSIMDDSVMRAIRGAAAPPIPEVIRAKVLSEGLTLTFKP